MTQKAPDQTRERIARAAIARVLAHGAAPLTLDAVAADAAVSKGGLLHHFPTKSALLRGVVEVLTRDFETLFDQALAQEDKDTPGWWSRAYIRTTFSPNQREQDSTTALGRVLAAYPELVVTCSDIFAASLSPQDDGLTAARRLLIRTSCDGWWLGELLSAPFVAARESVALRDELLALAR